MPSDQPPGRRCTVGRCWATFKALATVSAVAFGIVCIVLMPDYRIYAAFLVCMALIVYFQLWRFTPCDRSRVEAIVEERLEEIIFSSSPRAASSRRKGHSLKYTSSSRQQTPRRQQRRGSDANEASEVDSASRKRSSRHPKRHSESGVTPRKDSAKKSKHQRVRQSSRAESASSGGDERHRGDRTPSRQQPSSHSFVVNPTAMLHAPYGGSPNGGYGMMLQHPAMLPMGHHARQLTPTAALHHHQLLSGPPSPHYWVDAALPATPLGRNGSNRSVAATTPRQTAASPGKHIGFSGRNVLSPGRPRVVHDLQSAEEGDDADDVLAHPYALDMAYTG